MLIIFRTTDTKAVDKEAIKTEDYELITDSASVNKNDTDDEDISDGNSKQSQEENTEKCDKKLTPEHCEATFKSRYDIQTRTKDAHAPPHKHPAKRRRKTDVKHKVFCDVCNAGYTRRHDMEKHRKTKHPDAPQKTTDKNPCGVCGTNLKTPTALKRHLTLEHSVVKRQRRRNSEIVATFFCDVCNKGFTRKHDMQKHRASKHPNAPKLLEFEMKKKHVKMLERSKVPSNDNKTYYKCDTCNRLFRQSYNFIRHQSIHTGMFLYFVLSCFSIFKFFEKWFKESLDFTKMKLKRK